MQKDTRHEKPKIITGIKPGLTAGPTSDTSAGAVCRSWMTSPRPQAIARMHIATMVDLTPVAQASITCAAARVGQEGRSVGVARGAAEE